jgi:hypothetical protein
MGKVNIAPTNVRMNRWVHSAKEKIAHRGKVGKRSVSVKRAEKNFLLLGVERKMAMLNIVQ